MGGGVFAASDLIPAKTEIPFDLPTIGPDGKQSTTAVKESSTLRLYSTDRSKSNCIRGVDTTGNETVTPFKDVPIGAYYMEAVSWALDKNITTGTDANTFSPDKTCTRGEIVTFLWRAVNKPVSRIYIPT